MGKRYYAGIGSSDVKESSYLTSLIREIVELLSGKGFTLRSGGASGIDSIFERYVDGSKEIYLPYKGFNGNGSEFYEISEDSKRIAVQFHPMGKGLLNSSSINFHARNVYQVLGYELDKRCEFLIVWCKDEETGGTSQAIRIAKGYGIPYYNLYSMGNKELVLFWEMLNNL